MDQRRENVQRWLLKHKIKELEDYKGENKSLLSLVIPRFGKVSPVVEQLDVEFSNIEKMGGVDNQSTLWAIDSAREILKKVDHVSTRGFNVYTGVAFEDDGKQNRVCIQVDPFKPILTSTYQLDDHFDTVSLKKLLESTERIGVIVCDRSTVTFSTLTGSTKTLIHQMKLSHYLPSQHITESVRLAEKYYFDTCVQKAKVTGLILAGEKNFTRIMRNAFITQLADIIKQEVEVSYGGEVGLNYAIDMSYDYLNDLRFCYEKVSLQRFFRELKLANPHYFVGVDEMLNHIFELGAVKIVIVWEDFDANVCVMIRFSNRKLIVLNSENENTEELKGLGWEIVEEKVLVVKWLAHNHSLLGFDLDIISNQTQEGHQFCSAFGGIGGILNS